MTNNNSGFSSNDHDARMFRRETRMCAPVRTQKFIRIIYDLARATKYSIYLKWLRS